MKKENLIGQKFGRLTVIDNAPSKLRNNGKTRTYWKCRCECNNEKIIESGHLKGLKIISCGCFHKQKVSTINGLSKKYPNLYKVWQHMIKRCYNLKDKDYTSYGGRGIKVCDRWLQSFEIFLEDMKDTYQPELTIDRINNDGNYEPSNCKWSTRSQQQRNKRNSKITLEIANEIRNSNLPRKKLAEIYNVSKTTIFLIKNNRNWI